jgi:thiosulfate dehydrogenase (quinone) large subunit
MAIATPKNVFEPIKQRLVTPHEQAYSWSVPGRAQPFTFRYHTGFLPLLVLIGRLLFGFFFLWSGLAKVIHNGEWMGFGWFKGSAEHPGELFTFLNYSTGPLGDFWGSVANNATAMDVLAPLVVLGQVAIGLGLLLGLLTRLSLFSAGLMMLVFYSVNLWPLYNPFLNEYIFYIGIFAVLGALGAGRVLGADAWLEERPFVKNRPWLGWVLG